MNINCSAIKGYRIIWAIVLFLCLPLLLESLDAWTGADIGAVGVAGSDSYNGTTGVYTIAGGGADIFGTADAFHFVYQSIAADGELTARVASIQNTNASAKAAVMIRQSTDAGAITAFIAVTPTSGIKYYSRATLNGSMSSPVQVSTATAPYWIRVVKDSTLVTMYFSPDGITWTFATQVRLGSLTNPIDIGFAVCSHDTTTTCTATFDHITLTSQTTFAPQFPWQDQDIGSPGQAGQIHDEQYLWSLFGGGSGITGTSDSFHYAYQSLSGNGEAIAQVNGINGSTASAGVVMRQDLTAGSSEAAVLLNATTGVSFAVRSTSGGTISTTAGASVSTPYWVKLVRAGSTFYGYQSSNGASWSLVSSQTISMTGPIYVGVGSTSGNNTTLVLSVLDNVNVIPTGGYLSTGAISSGANHNLYLQTNGTVWAWGLNTNGQLGDGTTTTRTSPEQLTTLTGIAAVNAGASHSIAMANDGTVWSWGLNSSGQLGDGTTTQRTSPVHISTLSRIVAVSAGGSHSLALGDDGTVWSWGLNSSGQLGDGTTTTRISPVHLTTLSGIVAISAGGTHSIALKADGTVWVWGNNSTGQLGDGTTTSHSSPEVLASLSNMAAISAGYSHSLALNDDGTVWAWGDNSTGELGDGTTSQRLNPVHLTSLSGIIGIEASNLFSLALKNDGTVWAWGTNSTGQLGNNSTTSQNSPVQVSGLSGVVAISAGTSHSAVIGSSNAILTWGDNTNGQLGNGTTTGSLVAQSLTPVITSSTTASATSGSAFTYTITATNSPTSFNATGLPGGLSVSPTTGVISGTPTATGTFPITISASSVSGSGSATLTLTVASAGGGWTGADIGAVGVTGSDSYNSMTGVYTIAGGGADIFGTADAFHYVYQTLSSDGSLIARVASIQNTNASAKAAVMIRQSTAAGAVTAFIAVTPTGGIKYYSRATLNGSMSSPVQVSTSTAPYWLKIVKAGTTITMYLSPDGSTWTTATSVVLTSLTNPVDIGFAVCSHDVTTACTATFDNITLVGGGGSAIPAITSSASATGTVGSAFSYTIAATNSPTSFNATGLPGGLSVNTSTGAITGSPSTVGTSSVTISATNASGTGTQTLSLTVNPPAPVITSSTTASATSGSAFTYTITATNSPTSFNATGLPGGLSVSPTTGVISGTPTAGGTSSVTISATNVTGTGTAVLALTVNTASGTWTSADVGAVGISGSDSYSGGTYTVTGSGPDIGGTADAFHFVYQTLAADGSLTARVASLSYTNSSTKAGIMLRQSTAAGAIDAFLGLTPTVLKLYNRPSLNGNTSSQQFNSASAPYWLRVVKAGTVITTYGSTNGTSWTTEAQVTLASLTNPVEIGFAVCSHDSTTQSTAVFDNITVVGGGGSTLPVTTGLALWFKGDSGVKTTSGSVTEWDDQSGNGYNVTQTAGSSAPTLANDPVNGNPVVAFNGGQYLYSAAQTAVTHDVTIITVASNSNPSNTGTPIVIGNAYQSNAARALQYSTDGNLDFSNGAASVDGGSQPGSTLLNVTTATYSESTGAINFYSQGAANLSASLSASDVNAGATIGSILNYTNFSAWFGNIAEIVVYSRVLTSAEQQQVELYLAGKYNLQYTLPPPTITPNGGAASTVSISAQLSPVTVRYTLDGTNPTNSSPLYTTSLNLTQSCVVTCAYFLNSLQISSFASAQFYVGDTNQIGISDAWQILYFGQIGIDPNALSPGGSGLTNLQDYQYGYNPLLYSTNGDGLSDLENHVLGYAATNLDINNDGITNAQQLALGQDPFDSGVNPTPPTPPAQNPNDHTAPTITLTSPQGAVLVP